MHRSTFMSVAVLAFVSPAESSAQTTPPEAPPVDCTVEPTPSECLVYEKIIVGDTGTQGIDTNLNGKAVPADIGQIYIGNTVESADAITIDSGGNFPGGVAFRRYLGTPGAPQTVTNGTQLGYLDFRGYSSGQFYNAGSLDMVVDPGKFWSGEGLMPTKMRFAVSNGESVFIPMELMSNGRLELNSVIGTSYYGPGILGDPRFYVNSITSRWNTILASRAAPGTNHVLRLHSEGDLAGDLILGASSGSGSGSFKFTVSGNGDTYIGGKLYLGSRDLGAEVSSNAQMSDALAQRVANLEAGSPSTAGKLEAFASQSNGVATATGAEALAIGGGAKATTAYSTAIGPGAVASGEDSISFGNAARGNGTASVSIGARTIAAAVNASALGSDSQATAANATALGAQAKAVRDASTAIGYKALAQGTGAVSIGSAAVTTAQNAVALGSGAVATQINAVAIGAGARTTAANQITLGAAGSSVRIGDIDASTDAQEGPVDVVTVDANGTLGRRRAVTTAQVEQMSVDISSALAVTDQQFNQVQGQVNTLFDLRDHDRKDFKQAIAAVAAMATPAMPSEAGKTSYASNVSVFRGEIGLSAGVAHRFESENPFAITAGVTYAGGKNTAARVGVAGEF